MTYSFCYMHLICYIYFSVCVSRFHFVSEAGFVFLTVLCIIQFNSIQFNKVCLRGDSTARGPVTETAQTAYNIHKQNLQR